MYLSFNKIKIILLHLGICFSLILLQVYLPQIWIAPNLTVNVDILLIYLSCLVLIYQLHYTVYFAFMMGLFQDCVINIDMIGILSLLKSISVYLIGLINKYKFLWNSKMKIAYLYVIYFFHFLIYYYMLIDNNNYLILVLSILQSMVCLLIFQIIQYSFFKNKISD